MVEHACPTCGNQHEGKSAKPDVWHSRCSNCGALNREPDGDLSKADCRRCGKAELVALDDIPEAVTRYPHLQKTERGYEVLEPATT